MLHFDDLGPDTPRLPVERFGLLNELAASAVAHTIALLTIVTLARTADSPSTVLGAQSTPSREPIELPRIVCIAKDVRYGSSGGGGGGNQQSGPIRRAEGIGSDKTTLRIRKSPFPATVVASPPTAPVQDAEPLPSLVLDASPLASGTLEQLGLPSTGVLFGTSTGSGSGGGVGTGTGTGIGPGRGPGIGPGSGGGIGGGVYRAGGAVTAPRLMAEVRPKYTNDALRRKVQGTVVLELIVTRDGRPSHIRVTQSLDRGGLDEEAIAAVQQWRFEPGRLAGTPVDVSVIVMLDFCIR